MLRVRKLRSCGIFAIFFQCCFMISWKGASLFSGSGGECCLSVGGGASFLSGGGGLPHEGASVLMGFFEKNHGWGAPSHRPPCPLTMGNPVGCNVTLKGGLCLFPNCFQNTQLLTLDTNIQGLPCKVKVVLHVVGASKIADGKEVSVS